MEQTEKKTVSDYIGGFITAYRTFIIGFLLAVFVLAALVAGTLTVLSVKKEKGLAKLDSIEFELKKLETADADEHKKEELFEALKQLAEKSSGIVRTRAAMSAADIAFKDKNWEESCTYWLMAADSQKKAYTSPFCRYNAGVCSEEAGAAEKALAYFNEAAEYEGFPLAAHALFNAARIEEGLGNYDKAAEKYEKLNAAHASSEWAHLAKSRVIALRASGKIE